jgi:threonine aldolase
MVFDLRSDFLSTPPPRVVAAMAAAAARPDGFGLRESSEQQALERTVADLLGKQDALLFPTCTMANLAAVAAQVAPGEAVVAEAASHAVVSEAGGIAAVAGAVVHTLPGAAGRMDEAAVEDLLRRGADTQRPRVALVLLETTHNRAGGVSLPMDHIRAIGDLARAHGAALHVDGARFLNAAIALGATPAEMAAPATTVSLSLNKAVGAPNGAMLAGPSAVIARALLIRQRLGGGMRPAGALAAAARAALADWRPRLAADHANAAALARLLRAAGMTVAPEAAPTNILMVEPAVADLAAYLARLAARGVAAIEFGRGRVRLCLHGGIAARDLPAIAEAIAAARSEGTAECA